MRHGLAEAQRWHKTHNHDTPGGGRRMLAQDCGRNARAPSSTTTYGLARHFGARHLVLEAQDILRARFERDIVESARGAQCNALGPATGVNGATEPHSHLTTDLVRTQTIAR